MRRALVLSDETARHSFLASLPQHVRKRALARPAPRRFGLTAQDLRDFLMAYCAFFVVAAAFIA